MHIFCNNLLICLSKSTQCRHPQSHPQSISLSIAKMGVLGKFLVALFLYAIQYSELSSVILLVLPLPVKFQNHRTAANADAIDHQSWPNIVVALSILGTLACCPWTHLMFLCSQHRLPNSVAFTADVWLTAGLSAVLVRRLWLPALDVGYHLCLDAAAYAAAVVSGRCAEEFQPFIVWLQTDAVLWMRAALAAIFVWVGFVVTGIQAHVCGRWFEWFGRAPGDDARASAAMMMMGYRLDECCADDTGAIPAITKSAPNCGDSAGNRKSRSSLLQSTERRSSSRLRSSRH